MASALILGGNLLYMLGWVSAFFEGWLLLCIRLGILEFLMLLLGWSSASDTHRCNRPLLCRCLSTLAALEVGNLLYGLSRLHCL